MTNDERDRRGWPDEGGEPPRDEMPRDEIPPPEAPDLEIETQPGSEEPWHEAPRYEEAQPGEAQPEEPASPPWPTEPPLAGSAGASWPTTPPDRDADVERGWPTTPPDRDADVESGWPTAAPERGDEVAAAAAPEAPMAPMTHEPPPGEIEAYDAAPPAGAPTAGAAHSVPATAGAVAESTLCPRCGTENPAGLAFCRNCGQRLVAAGVAPTVERPVAPEGTMACPRCGTHNRAGVAFCQNCGANLRTEALGYVPPAVEPAAAATPAAAVRTTAVLGPVVLVIGVVGLVTAYLLPFAFSTGASLYERAVGAGGYGVAFWTGYADVAGGLAEQAYYGFAAPSPVLMVLLLLLAIGGLVRAVPGPLQLIGLAISLVWSVGLAVLFGVVEVAANWQGDLVALLRVMTPAGIIFFLAALIVLIGTLTRFGRS